MTDSCGTAGPAEAGSIDKQPVTVTRTVCLSPLLFPPLPDPLSSRKALEGGDVVAADAPASDAEFVSVFSVQELEVSHKR